MQFPSSPSNLPIHHLTAVFHHTSASYKFYWFLSILKDIEINNRQSIPVNELLIRMVAMSWFPINFYKLSFGKNDSLANIIKSILEDEQVELNLKSTEKEVYQIISNAFQQNNKAIKKEIKTLSYNVPYRFLSPFFSTKLSGIKSDYQRHQMIVTEANQQYTNSQTPPIYSFEKRGNEEFIVIHLHWLDYFKTHLSLIKDFCYWNLLKFLQKRNANVPNIANKLFPPPKRAPLTTARKFWDLAYIESAELSNCIFSKQSLLENKFDVDHFIPWSFVAHDQLWNLIPIAPAVNSSKSNHLPDLNTYFSMYAHQHFSAFQIAFHQEKKTWLEDYSLLFNQETESIAYMQESQFTRILSEHISPLQQIAANAGFSSNWIYSK